jgi:transcription initiation factor TFIIH subunit 3
MDVNVDGSEHYAVPATDESNSLLVIVIDTNPRVWAALRDILPLSKAISNLVAFINAHLAFNNANQVAVIASHTSRAVWLYPAPPLPKKPSEDVDMPDAYPKLPGTSADKFPQFAEIEKTVLSSVKDLMGNTTEQDLDATTTQVSGALTMALAYINKKSILSGNDKPTEEKKMPHAGNASTVRARILVISVSDSESSQYIPTMNAVFAAAHSQIMIDTLALSGDSAFLQQAAFITNGTFIKTSHPQGIISYLMRCFLADADARTNLIASTHHTVDFRAACFCHGKVVDTGFVCSICLSIFCEVPEGAECLTCGTKLALGNYGAKPAVLPRKKKKKKKIVNGSGREETGSATGTPRP